MSKRRIADILEDLLDRLVSVESKVDRIAGDQATMAVAVVEVGKDVRLLHERLIEEAEIRAGVGVAVMSHDVELSIIRGGRSADGGE